MAKKCSECGAALITDEAMCASCLLATGLETQEHETAATVIVDRGSHSSRTMPQVGEIFGRYQIDAALGQGGMGKVYDAVQIDDDRRVALKVLGRELDSPEARQRFLREGRLAAAINHPHCVYIYGTEEVNGTPAIAMELVSGGNLEDQVRENGPMAINKAVDAILQVIDGLEAADAVGILHRDVKPSNCFVDVDGTVKIGDFGLSISTTGGPGPMITKEGVFIGTPAFSSPEQIRGDRLDARSDIYSVGITLYYLLTGEVPFEAANVGQLLATILEKKAEAPTQHRSNIPPGLSQAVLRCLEKRPGDRYKDYGELRHALYPFGSASPQPAALTDRFWAMILDQTFLRAAHFPAWYLLGYENLRSSLVMYMITVFYYCLWERYGGASPGKYLLGLRVMDINGGHAPLTRYLLRATLVELPAVAGLLVYWLWSQDNVGSVVHNLFLLLPLVFFVTARRGNQLAGIHDLWTNIRVTQVRKPVFAPRAPISAEVVARPHDVGSLRQIGPYHVLSQLGNTNEGELLLAYDARLLRKVWLHRLPEGAPPVAAHLRSLGRRGRLRWLTGKREGKDCWDAYEAISGTPLLQLVHKPQTWPTVRGWLGDLTEELGAAETDLSHPEQLTLDRVWICQSGQAKLLDFLVPGLSTPAAHAVTTTQPEAFIHQVAITALHGQPVSAKEAKLTPTTVPIPLHARALLEQLRDGLTLSALQSILQATQPLLASVTLRRRAALMLSCLSIPVLFIAFLLSMSILVNIAWGHMQLEQPQLFPLYEALCAIDELEENASHRRLHEIYVATKYQQTIKEPSTWNSIYARFIFDLHHEKMANELLAVHADVSPTERAEALEIETTATIIPEVIVDVSEILITSPNAWGDTAAGFLTFAVAIPSLVAAFITRGGLLLASLRLTVVRADGRPASRGRVFWRALVTWLPVFALTYGQMTTRTSWTLVIILVSIVAAFLLLLVPGKSIVDRLSGTCLVPK